MLKYNNILKRFCHHYSRDMFRMPKPANPLVECEHRPAKTELQHTKPLSIQPQYSKNSKNSKTYTIVIEISK
jgi:hypothetical protein